MAEILSKVSVACFILAGACLVLAVFLWFRFDIRKVYNDLTLRTAKKQIAKIRESNEKSGNKSFRPSDTNMMRGKLTGTMPDMGDDDKYSIGKRKAAELQPETGLLAENRAEAMPAQEETELLSVPDTREDEEATALLDQPPAETIRRTGGVKLTMLDEVILIHTDEVMC